MGKSRFAAGIGGNACLFYYFELNARCKKLKITKAFFVCHFAQGDNFIKFNKLPRGNIN